jgi:Uma2 family endonuclease
MLTAEKKKYTVDDYMMLEEGAPFQLINYDLIMSPAPTPFHQAIVARLSKIMLIFLEDKQMGGYTAGAPDVVFDNGNVFQPDFLYIRDNRVNELVKDRIEGPPDMAIEILSPSNAYYDLIQKKEVYEKYGVKEYIIFDPLKKNAHLYALKDGVYYLHQRAEGNELLYSLVLPGFSFDLNYLFK